MIKGIFFDFDGVITTDSMGSPGIISYLAKATGLDKDAVWKAYFRHNNELLIGDKLHEDMWEEFCNELGTRIDPALLKPAFLNIDLDPNMVELIRELKKNYMIGMITDNKADRIHTILEETVLKGLFDVVVISAECHSRKTTQGIFDVTLEKSGLKASECAFIDNTLENLVIPKEMGFETIFFDDKKRDMKLLTSLIP